MIRSNNVRGRPATRRSTGMLTAAGAVSAVLLAATPASAALVSACSGVRLPASTVTGLLSPLVTNGVTPIQTDVNALLGVTRLLPGGGILPATPLSFDGVGFLNNIIAGGDINLAVIKNDGTLFGPTDTCNTTTDSLQLNNPAGLSIGGNKITGLGGGAAVATAGEINSIALGNGATTAAAAAGSIAIGTGASATVAGGVAIGTGSVDRAAAPTAGVTIGGNGYGFAGTMPTSVVSVGTGAGGANSERQIVNVAAGQLTATSTDAVNGSQLFATNTAVNLNSAAITTNTTAITNLTNGTAGPVQQSGTTGRLVLVAPGATGAAPGTPQVLGNVAPGSLAAGSTDAVNGGQLAATNAAVTTNTTNIAGNTTAITNLTSGINGGTIGLVQQTGGSPGTGAITVGAATGGTSLNVAGTGGNRVISGVAAGVAPTDAANVGQLAATNANVTTNTTNIAGNTTAITNLNNGTAGTVQRTATANKLTLTAPGGTGAAPGTAQVLSNVAAGIAPTDAVNLGQVGALIGASAGGPVQYSNAAAPTTPTPGVVSNSTTLVGTAPGQSVALHNVTAGVVAAGSTDAVNGSQLAATNATVAGNTTNIAGNTTAITNLTNGTAGLVQQTGGAPGTGQITVGGATGGTSVSIAGMGGGNRTLTGLNAGVAGNDAVTVAQVNGLTGGGLNNVQYDPTAAGGRSNTITLAGGAPGTVLLTNVTPGVLTAGSTDAVNGGELYAVNQQVGGLVAGTVGAFQSNNANAAPAPVASGANASAGGFGASATGAGSVALGNGATSTGTGSVALGQGSTDGGQARVVSVGGVGSERRITNVGPAVNGTDAVNLSQLQAATNSFTTTTTGLQNEINQTNFDLNNVRRRANGGTAGAMAVAGLPQAFEPGKSMIGGAVGYWADQVAFAIGVSSIVGDRTVIKAGGSISGQGVGGFNAGVGFQF